MKLTKLFPIAIMAFGALIGCGEKGPSIPTEKEDGTHTIEIVNKADLEADWMAKGSARTVDLKIATSGVEGNPTAEMLAGNLTLKANDTSVISVEGLTINSLKVGTAYLSVQYYQTVKVVKFSVVEKPAEPAVKEGTVADILADPNGAGGTKYKITGYIHDWRSKKSINTYGEFSLSDTMEEQATTAYIYGSYANCNWEWTGEKFKLTYDKRDFDTAELTKNAKVGDKVTMYAIRADYGTTVEVIGQVIALEPGADVPATAITLNKTGVSIEADATETVAVSSLQPWNCNMKGVWASDKPEVATVENGMIKGIAEGKAVVSYTIGDVSATVNVTVSPAETDKMTLRADNLCGYDGKNNMPYRGDEQNVTLKNVTYAYKEIGCYGNGMQMRYKKITAEKDVKDGHELNQEYYSDVHNTTALPSAIDHIEINFVSGKAPQDDQTDTFSFKFGTAAGSLTEEIKLSLVGGQLAYSVDPVATDAKFFSMTRIHQSYANYIQSIVICYIVA